MSVDTSAEARSRPATATDPAASIASLIPNLRHRGRMLRDLGLASVDALFEDVPADVRIDGLDLPGPIDERGVVDHLAKLAGENRFPKTGGGGMPVFLGAGVKERYIPATVRSLVLRSEFYTSYTPYQPEISQGMLQALFEFQSIACELTGLDVANVSQYDWATALGEAALMAARANKGQRFLVPEAMTPEKRSVLENYVAGPRLKVEEIPFDRKTGTLDMAAFEAALGPDVVGAYIETPNLFGLWETEAHRVKGMLDDHDSGLLVVGADPLSLALAEGPGQYGADIVVGELGGFGVPMSFGGPLVGLLATTKKLVRKMPGRIVGLTHDDQGRHGFTLTLQAREQHIRRDRAMSNICTNQTLAAVAATIHLSQLGGEGLTRLALENEANAAELRSRLAEVPGVRPAFDGACFEEFTLAFDRPYAQVHGGLLSHDVHGGYDISGRFKGLDSAAVFATTEMHQEADYARLVAALKEVQA